MDGDATEEPMAPWDVDRTARKALSAIEEVRLQIALLQRHAPQKGRALAITHTKLDEARLWLQDAIGYDRKD